MKWFVSLLLVLGLLLSGCSATSAQQIGDTGFEFYYEMKSIDQLNSRNAVESETRYLGELPLPEILRAYFSGPQSDHLKLPFPEGTRVVDTVEEADRITLTLSGEFFTLNGVNLAIAESCLVHTVFSCTGIREVTILDEMNQARIDLSPDTFLFADMFNAEANESFTVYFADERGRYLVEENREVMLSENEPPEAYLLRQLIEGPEGATNHRTLPAGTKLLSVKTEDQTCIVDLSQEFLEGRSNDDYENYLSIYSVVNTLTGLSGITSVEFRAEGEKIQEYGIFDLSSPVPRYTAAIGYAGSRGSAVDVDLHALSIRENQPFSVPAMVNRSVSEPEAEAVVKRLLSYEPPQGFYSPIPFGTELLSIDISASTCYVDLSRRFVPQEDTRETEQAAVWSLVSTLLDLESVNSVLISIEGDSSGLQYVDISKPLTEKDMGFR